jgi:hypothetical protein
VDVHARYYDRTAIAEALKPWQLISVLFPCGRFWPNWDIRERIEHGGSLPARHLCAAIALIFFALSPSFEARCSRFIRRDRRR